MEHFIVELPSGPVIYTVHQAKKVSEEVIMNYKPPSSEKNACISHPGKFLLCDKCNNLVSLK